jgi:lysophospholipid hydrolase
VIPITKSTLPKDPDAVTALKNLREKVQIEIQKFRRGTADIRPQRLPHINDFARLARRICGRSIGLVLGGGGARGIAHLVGYTFLCYIKPTQFICYTSRALYVL